MAKKDLILIVGVDDKGTPVIKRMSRNVRGELERLDKGARKSGKGFNKLKKDTDDSAKGLSKFKGMMKSTMMQMAAGMGVMMGVQGAVRGIKNIITDFIKTGREFEKTWANVTTMLTVSEKETLKLKNQLIGLSPTLGSTTELAKGMYQVLSASVDPAKAVMFLGEAAKSAVAGVTDAFVAVDALTTVINAYGYAAEQVTEVSDIMFQTVKRGKLTYEGMAGALGTVVPIASQVGISFEEIGAAMATLTRQGIDVNTTTVQLRQIMVSVLKPTSMAETAAKRLGIQFDAVTMKSMGLQKFLTYVMDAINGDAEAMTSLFGNVRALTGIMGLAGKSAAAFASDLELMGNASGSTEEAFRKQMKSLDFWIKTAANALEKMKIAFYEGLVGPVRDVLSSQEDLDKAFESLTDSARMLGEAIGSVGRVIKLFQPVINLAVGAVGKLDKKVALLIQGITFGLVPAWSDLESAEERARVEAGMLALEEKKLESNMKGIWGVLSRGAILWKEQVDYYINSGMAVEDYLKELRKLWKGQAKFQESLKGLQAVEALGLKTKRKLKDELLVLTNNIEAAAASDKVFTQQLETHIKRAMLLAEITKTQLSPAIKALIEELDLVKEKAVKYLDTLKGVRTGTKWWNYESVNMRTVLQNVRSELNSASFAWGKVTLKMRESSDFMKKYALSLPPAMTDPPLTGLEKFANKFSETMQKIGMYVGIATTQWDAMWNQMYTNQIQRIDNEYQARKQAIDDSMMGDQEKYFAIEKLDREMQKKRLAAMRKQAMATKVSSIIEATINTAVAFTAALKAGGFIGIILAGIVAAMGAAQIAMIAAQPLPSFAEGGIALTPQVATVAERGPEAIAPLGDLVSMIREAVRSELETSPTAGRSQVLRLHQDVYIAGDKVEEKVTEMVMHKAEVGDLTFPAKVIR